MNRLIKFKAWDNVNKYFIDAKWIKFGEDGDFLIESYGGYGKTLDSENIELLQFSGLKDKSDKQNEVYEGDIIEEIGWQGDYYVVEFIDCAFYARSVKIHVPAGLRSRYVKLDELMDIQIVGNKFDNPELLEGDNKS